MDTNIMTLNAIGHYLSWIILKYVWKGEMWHKLVYEKLRLTQLWMIRNYSVFLAEKESINCTDKQTRRVPVMCSIAVQNRHWFAVCCYTINGNTHMKSFIKAFIWKWSKKKITEMYFDKWVVQVKTTAYSELQIYQLHLFPWSKLARVWIRFAHSSSINLHSRYISIYMSYK